MKLNDSSIFKSKSLWISGGVIVILCIIGALPQKTPDTIVREEQSVSEEAVQEEETKTVEETISEEKPVVEEEPKPEEEPEATEEKDRVQKNGFTDKTGTATIGNYVFSVPIYWKSQIRQNTVYRASAESGESFATLEISAQHDDEDSVTFDLLKEEDSQGLMAEAFDSWFSKVLSVESEEYATDVANGFLYTIDFLEKVDEAELPGTAKCFVFSSESDNSWIYVTLAETDNTEYLYDDDYERMLKSIEVKPEEEKSEVNPSKTAEEIRKERVETRTKLPFSVDNRYTNLQNLFLYMIKHTSFTEQELSDYAVLLDLKCTTAYDYLVDSGQYSDHSMNAKITGDGSGYIDCDLYKNSDNSCKIMSIRYFPRGGGGLAIYPTMDNSAFYVMDPEMPLRSDLHGATGFTLNEAVEFTQNF